MKRYSFIFVLLLSSVTLLGQKRLLQPEIYLGVHGGAVASTVFFSPQVSYMTPITKGCVLGGEGGLVFRYSEQKCCAIQIELNYLQRGWAEKGQDAYGSANYTRKLHYIEMPVLMHLYFGSSSFRGFVNVGPQIGYCVKEEMLGEQAPFGGDQYKPIDNRFDWGVGGGLGCYYRSRNAGVYQFDIRVGYSLGTVFSNKAGADFSKSNPLTVGVGLAWLWEFKTKDKK
ncbi:MAG: PorT family protein [Paludibacteraceae bacterium]|nr:PorT family protein [Paludibacteraceae bacterium]